MKTCNENIRGTWKLYTRPNADHPESYTNELDPIRREEDKRLENKEDIVSNLIWGSNNYVFVVKKEY